MSSNTTTSSEVVAGKRSLEQVLANLEPLLKPSEVAEYFGMTERSVWNLCMSGDLKSVKLGQKSIRVRLSDLMTFIEARQSK